MEKKIYQMKIESYNGFNNLEDLVFNICKEEIEVVDQIRDLTLNIQDLGIDLIFKIVYKEVNNLYTIYKVKNSEELSFNRRYEYLFKRDPHKKSNLDVQIKINGVGISLEILNELKESIRSYFPDWKFNWYKNSFKNDLYSFEICLWKMDVYHDIGKYIN